MDFYYSKVSAGCRAIIMTAKALGVELNKIPMDLRAGDQLKPEFIKLNPQHTIPTLVDNGFSVWETRAILAYLVEKYGKNDDKLFPKCPKKRAVINQRLYFDMGTMYKSFADYYYPLYRNKTDDPEAFKKVETAFGFLNTFLEGHDYVAGDDLTIADLALLATVSTFDIAGFDIKKYENVSRWYENGKKVAPAWEENWAGCVALKEYFK